MDLACRHHHHCQQCTSMDHGGKCHADRAYAFALSSKNGEKSITCLDDSNGGPAAKCRRDLCECDKQLAWHYFLYKNSYQVDLSAGSFDKQVCHDTSSSGGPRTPSQSSQDGFKSLDKGEDSNSSSSNAQGQTTSAPGHIANQCCGQNPNRYPYFSGLEGSSSKRDCCGQMLFKTETQQCCKGSILNSFDEC